METKPIETITKGDKTLKIYQDECIDSPREWDNLGKMVLSHKRYNLPNELNIDLESRGCDLEQLKQFLQIEHKARVLFIVKGYDHSGLNISVSNEYPFNDYWDSGILGFIIAREEDILKEFGDLSPITLKKVEEILKQEVKLYNQYLNGDVYSYTISAFKKCDCCAHIEEEIKDSCGGYYGSEGIEEIKRECGF